MKRLKRIFSYLLFAVITITIALVASAYLYKDRIINQFIQEANKSLNTPVTIGKIEVSVFQDFPNLSIVFNEVYVEGSHPGKDTLLIAKRISFSLNSIDLWNGEYTVRGLRIQDSRTRLRINAVGKTNYNILKESEGKGGAIAFDLKNVRLLNTDVSYQDFTSRQHHIFSSEKLIASISVAGSLYNIEATGQLTTKQIEVGRHKLLKEKDFDVKASLVYDDDKKHVDIHPSELKLAGSEFSVDGTYSFLKKNEIDLRVDGKETDIQTIIALLPDEISQKLNTYESSGEVFFGLTLKGELSDARGPYLSVSFGCSNATVFHPTYQSKITNANLEGTFVTSSYADLSRAELSLKNIKGELNGQEFTANFSLRNFDRPYVTLDFAGELDAASLLHFYSFPNIADLSGELKADFSFEGDIELLKRKSTAQQVRTDGTLDLHGVNITTTAKEVHLKNLNGSLQFNNNDVALSDVSGQLENSDFILNGHFTNIITYLLFENQPVGIEADLKSKFIDLDQLFQIGYGDRTSENYEFAISPNLYLNFNCDVGRLHYKKFKPRKIRGNLLIKNEMAVSREITVNAMGGSLMLNGIIDAKNPKAIDVVGGFKLNGVHLDSLFYLFDNFHQDFIQDKHLKGQAYADVNVEMVLNEKLNLFQETLIADASATIKNGELNNFEPMKELDHYLDDEGLSKLRFADLRNDIHIENKTVFIPQMQVESNVTNIQLSGTHTFDQQIDYRVIAPLRSRKKIDPDEAFGAIEEDNRGQIKLFLKITGTTDDYDVAYDKEAVKQKIAADLKKEVQELREAFKLKGTKKKKELELSGEEFDWDDN